MPEIQDAQNRIAGLREERDRARASVRETAFALRELDTAIAAAERSGSEQQGTALDRLRRQRDEFRRTLPDRQRALIAAKSASRSAVEALVADPRLLIEQMPDNTPFLLLPLRIETKFSGTASAPSLDVRVFPDDAEVALHEKALTVVEADAGRTFWRESARANQEADAQVRQNGWRGAWNTLAGRHGAYRAGWIARTTKPTNWTETIAPAALTFPAIATKPAGWSQVPRSFVLPDRFVFTLISGNQVLSRPGALIPDDLALGPDPLQTEALLSRDETTGRIKMDDELRWLVDFERAVDAGMALRIALDPPWNDLTIERLIVLGVRASSSAADGAGLLKRLIESHRFSRGASVVAQGTPTNNMDDAKSGFTTGSSTVDETFEVESNPALVATTDPMAKADGQRLAEALSLPLEIVAAMPAAHRADVSEAMAMNRALWGATLGGFLRDMIKPLISDDSIDATETFFTQFVLGRGLLPAIRIGSQPYGVLATSAVRRWAWSPPETGRRLRFWTQLLEHLQRLEDVWRRELVPDVSHVGKRDDPFAHLLKVIGQQASSVEFYARKAVSDDYLWNYIRLKGTPRAFATEVWEDLQSKKGVNLNRLGLNVMAPFKLKELTFWREHDQLTGPVIDGDPKVPLSEEKPIRPYDGTRNYIDWLISGTRAELVSQTFIDAEGKSAPVPLALLYQLLRHAYLSELGRSGVMMAKLRAPAVFAAMPDEPSIANIGASKSLLQRDIVNIDTAKIGVTTRSTAVGDYLLDHARAVTTIAAKPVEAVPLAGMTNALRMLAKLPTARLERAFAEHIDICGYRVDAWIQGLFARRLEMMRSAENPQTNGIYLGAFGWVEDLRRGTRARRPVPAEELPDALRADVTGPVTELLDNGGYVHTPSLTHAVTASVLRNAYLSHAEPARAGTMAVNLSSARVRTAMSYLEGLQNGQQLASLLGYQLERGLHERHPGVELDEFVYVLRERFPLISNKIAPVADGSPAEVVEARNVVNGYDLLEFIRGKSYPYGIAGLPLDAPRSEAIKAEIDRLADAMDAISDVMLAESVHQAVQGNYDRAKGVLQSITEGEAPPDLDVVRTPRSGRGLTHRVAVQLDPGSSAGWQPSLTPRAAANAPLNAWLATVLPPPAHIQWTVTPPGASSQVADLDALGLEPIDVVLTCGEGFGQLGSELERIIVEATRRTLAIADDVRTFVAPAIDVSVPAVNRLVIDFRAAQPGRTPIASIWPLFKSLRRIISQSRPLHATDFSLPIEAQSEKTANPKGWDAGELKTRVDASHAAVESKADALTAKLATVHPMLTALQNDPSHTIVPAWNSALASLRTMLVDLVRAGTGEAVPSAGLAVTEANITTLIVQADAIEKAVRQRLDAARTLLDTTFTDPLPPDPEAAARVQTHRMEVLLESYAEAAKLLMGRSFVVLPLFSPRPALQLEVAAALAAPIEKRRLAIEEWLQSLTRVRPAIASLGWLATYYDWLHSAPFNLVPIQLPVRAGDRWIGGKYDDKLGDGEVVSMAICNPASSAAGAQCGLLIDEWTEVVPTEKETTGLAFHANRPNAQPPQTLLVAIPPVLRGTWRWDDLLAIVTETLDRAKIRAIEPDQLLTREYFQLMPSILTEFSNAGLVSTSFSAHYAAFAKAQ